ncbi:MAG: winged helix-turn-helix domain-containing protein [Burkholderiaceae bacterium]|jgi:DNA-binding response OmpR family regulator|nr:winged helix-turn-helix domain-containing protein [Burkholderiaceae bacterium]
MLEDLHTSLHVPAGDSLTHADTSAARAHDSAERPRVLLITASPAATLGAEVDALQRAGLLCLVAAPDDQELRRATMWRPDAALLVAFGVPAARCLSLLKLLRAGGVARVAISGAMSAADALDEPTALQAGFDAAWHDGAAPDLLCTRLIALVRQARGGVLRTHGDGVLRNVRAPAPIVQVGPLQLQRDPPVARFRGRPLPLSVAQTALLLTLASAPDGVLARDEPLDGRLANAGLGLRALDTRICRLRQRLRQATCDGVDIVTLRDVGYALVVHPQS